MLSLFSGGAISRIAIFALNLGPYLSAAILVQVALLFSSGLRAVNDRGDRGRRIVSENRLDYTHDPPTYAIQSGRLDRDGDRPELGPIRGEWIFFPAVAGRATHRRQPRS